MLMELVENLKKKMKQLNRWSLIIIFLFLLLFSLFLYVVLRNTSNENEVYSSNVKGVTSKIIKTGDNILLFRNTYHININYSSNAYIDQTYSLGLSIELLDNELNYSLYLSEIRLRLLFLDSTTGSIDEIHSIFPDIYLSLEPIFDQVLSFSFPHINTGNCALQLLFVFPEPNPEIDEQVIVQLPIKVFKVSTFDKVASINPLIVALPSIILFTLLRRKKNGSNRF